MTEKHPLEQAGLGRPPYTYDSASGGNWPYSACMLCGQQDRQLWIFKSSDGKKFALDAPCLSRFIEGKQAKVDPVYYAITHAVGYDSKQILKWIREHARIESAKQLLEHPGVKQVLQGRPSPYGFRAAKGDTYYDYYAYELGHAFTAGKTRAAKAIEKIAGVTTRDVKSRFGKDDLGELAAEVKGLLK